MAKKKLSISFSDSAVHDLDDIAAWYAAQDVPEVGARVVSGIVSDIEALRGQPDMGRLVPEFELEFLRELIRPPFRIVYRRDGSRIRIVRIWRSERRLKLP